MTFALYEAIIAEGFCIPTVRIHRKPIHHRGDARAFFIEVINMKEIIVDCPHCAGRTVVTRKTYKEINNEIKEWHNEDQKNEAALDALEDIKQYSGDKKDYISWYYSVTPDYCCKCKEPFYYNHKSKTVEYIKKVPEFNLKEICNRLNSCAIASGYVYFLQDTKTGLVKIGCSKDPLSRKKSIDSTYGLYTRMLLVIEAGNENNMYQCEKKIHHIFDKYRHNREWFMLPENTVSALINEGKQYNEIKAIIEAFGEIV